MRKGSRHSDESKLKMSKVKMGKPGHPHSDESKLKMSIARKGKPNGRKGKPHSEEHSYNIAKALKGNTNGRGNKGKHPSEGARRKMRLAHKGKPSNWKGKHPSEEARRKMRVAAINREVIPNYNPRACKYFDFINHLTNTEGQHALNGGEKRILNYYLDYFNPELKLILEWDEPYHYSKDGNLRTCDVQRQKEIQEVYPDFTFTRVKQ